MSKTNEQYINELDAVYKKHYCNENKCSCYSECSNGMPNPKIECDYSTRVGVNYADCSPKVMMIGQESLNPHYEHNIPTESLEEDSNNHYRKTLFTLAKIISGEEPDGYSINDLKKYNELLTKFCLTNYFKCAFTNDKSKAHGLKHNKAMKKNCCQLLLEEINVLEPDLLVVQGKFTTKDFWNKLEKNGYELIWANNNKNISLYKYEYNGKPLYVLYSYHPSAYGKWYETKDDLMCAIDEFRKDIQQ